MFKNLWNNFFRAVGKMTIFTLINISLSRRKEIMKLLNLIKIFRQKIFNEMFKVNNNLTVTGYF